MRYVKLGSSGLEVSQLALGCMSFGEPTRGHPAWSLDESASRKIIKHALEAGINFFDTANVYSLGSSEEIVGRALRDMSVRDEVVVSTKLRFPMREGPNGQGLSRKAILTEVDHSLRRLGTDYIDLYQIHRADAGTPWEETLEALDSVVRAGKVRYLGASSMPAWQFATALHLQRHHGWARFVSMQDHYNLLAREEEREMIPLCLAEGVGTMPWSPLARGRLARTSTDTARADADATYAGSLYREAASDEAIVAAVAQIAANRGVSRAQVALAWLRHRPGVVAPVVGATRGTHLADAVASLDLGLTTEEIDSLESPYTPRLNEQALPAS